MRASKLISVTEQLCNILANDIFDNGTKAAFQCPAAVHSHKEKTEIRLIRVRFGEACPHSLKEN